jgi:oligosaccharide repeat unit polymerase
MSLTLLGFVDCIGICLFAISYYSNCYRKGYRIDFWHMNLFLTCVLPNMLMFPFADSEGQALVLGRDYQAVAAAVPAVFMVTMIGYAAMLVGGALWRLRLGFGARKAAWEILEFIPRCSMMLMSSRSVLVFQALLCLAMEVGILAVNYSKVGFNFNLRNFGFDNPEYRPIIQGISFYSSIIGSHCLARYVDRKEKILLLCNLGLAFGLLLFGSRGGVAGIYLGVLVCSLIRRRDSISLGRLVLLAVSIVIAVLYLGSVRAGQYSIGQLFTGLIFLVLYGNNFSDLRDFAWVYSAWDHSFWLGKTYLAALTPFVPRFVSSFRDTWGMGAATAATAGFDPHTHPGLRPGAFGEGYFNFGVLGVILVGLMMGLIVRRVDIDVKRVFASSDPSMMRAFASTALLSVAGTFAISVNSSALYALAGVYAISWLLLQLKRMLIATNRAYEERALRYGVGGPPGASK